MIFALLKAIFAASLEHLTKLLGQDKVGVDADRTSQKERDSFESAIRRKYDDELSND